MLVGSWLSLSVADSEPEAVLDCSEVGDASVTEADRLTSLVDDSVRESVMLFENEVETEKETDTDMEAV